MEIIYIDECCIVDISMFGNTDILSIVNCMYIKKFPKKMNMHTLQNIISDFFKKY